jgi:hypothetical protein
MATEGPRRKTEPGREVEAEFVIWALSLLAVSGHDEGGEHWEREEVYFTKPSLCLSPLPNMSKDCTSIERRA